MPYESVLLDKRNAVAYLTLNRPDAANAFDMRLARDLLGAAIECDEDAHVRAVVVTGSGKMFCAGGDLKSFRAQGANAPAHLKELTMHLHGAISRLAWMDAPVIAAVNGTAAGAGLSLVCATDYAIAARSARFTMAYTQVGLTPDGSSTYFLARAIGLRRAKELALTNRVLDADEAAAIGIVNRVVPDAELADAVREMAERLAAGPTGAYGATKRLMLLGAGDGLEAQMERETRAIAGRVATADGREGIAAFLEKRKPDFKGD